jgi:hypothetical protein
MARIDAERKLNEAANDLTRLFRDELTKQGLVDSGRLRDSIKWIVVTTTSGYSLKMEALDYFEFLDRKFNITNNVLNSLAYQRVQEQIAEAYNYIILDELDSI